MRIAGIQIENKKIIIDNIINVNPTIITSNTNLIGNMAYVNNGNNLFHTLPQTSTVGDRIIITGRSGRWAIKSHASATAQKIHQNGIISRVSSSSAIDLLYGVLPYSSVTLTCVVANSEWIVDYCTQGVYVSLPYWTDLVLYLRGDSPDAGMVSLNDGDAVETWYDDSGQDHDPTNAVGAEQPIFQKTSINGLPALSFDGLDDNLLLSSSHLGKPASFTIFGVYSWYKANFKLAQASPSPQNDHYSWGLQMSVGEVGGTNSNGSSESVWRSTTGDIGKTVLACIRYATTETVGEIWINQFKAPVTSITSDSNANTGTAFHFAIGKNGQSSSYYHTGQIAEILIFNTAIPDANVRLINQHLMNKYNLK